MVVFFSLIVAVYIYVFWSNIKAKLLNWYTFFIIKRILNKIVEGQKKKLESSDSEIKSDIQRSIKEFEDVLNRIKNRKSN